ncbi:MFS transporter [Haladaptatus sp. DJG-WS-42]|uniref:MFS transporter n=1 Tax=Haladaptatus sp. DJG-WS-42 TaxID=3120516 RepID=UPI0030CF1852
MAVSKWRSYGVLSGLFFLTAGFIAYAIAPASVLPLFMESFAIDRSTASASISAVFFTWALLQIPGGYVLDRYDNRRLVLGGGAVFVLAAASSVFVTSYAVFLAFRLLSGACAVFIVVGSVNVLSRTVAETNRALSLSVFIASPPLGVALAQFAGPQLALASSWQTAFLAYIALALVGYLLFFLALRDPIPVSGRVSIRQFATTLRNPHVLLISVANLCTYAVWTFLTTWMPSYGTDVLGINLAAAGAATALVPLAGIVARPGGGWLSEVLEGRLRPVILVSFAATVPMLYGLSSAPSPVVFAVFLALTGAAVNLSVGLYLVYVNRLTDASTQGTSLSVLLTFSQVGNLIAPVVGGWVITQLSWTAGFGFAGLLAVLGFITILLAPATRDSVTRPRTE